MRSENKLFENQPTFETALEKHAEQIKTTLEEAMQRSLADIEPDQKIGIALSGGIDSTIVAHLLKKLGRDNIIAYTLHIEGHEETDRDLEPAIAVASALGIEHRIIRKKPADVENSVEPVAKLITPPERNVHDFNVYSGVVTDLLASEMKKDGIEICFSGEGVDELVGSYGPSGSFQKSHEEMTTIEMRQKLFKNLTERGYLDRTTKTLGQYDIDARSPYLDPEFSELMLKIPPEFFNQDNWKLPVARAFENELPIPLNRPKVRAQVGSGVFQVLQEAGYDQKKLEQIMTDTD